MLRLPLHLQQRRILGGNALHQRLRWFTRDWLRYDVLGNALVVTDLRMGVAGYYSFRFVMAERDADGAWHGVTPRRWPSGRGGWPQIRLLLARIFNSRVPLPLADWSAHAPETRAAP